MNNIWEWNEIKYCIKKPWKFPKLLIYSIKYSWQRITKGYCDKDLCDIDYWFMNIIPNMLQEFKDTKQGSPAVLGEDYIDDNGISCNDTCHEEWDKILEEMIFLFREMNEETCTKKNVYEEEYDQIMREFEEKYGRFGELLETKKNKHGRRIHSPGELPEYSAIESKYYDEEKFLNEYRNMCKDKAIAMFAKWFHALWD